MVRARGPPTICLADHSIATALPSDSPDDIQAAIEGVPREVLAHVIDVHCHPTDSDMAMTHKVADDMAIRVCAMATRRSDQKLVADLARAHPDKVIPCFGWCPVLRVPRPPYSVLWESSSNTHLWFNLFSRRPFRHDM